MESKAKMVTVTMVGAGRNHPLLHIRIDHISVIEGGEGDRCTLTMTNGQTLRINESGLDMRELVERHS